MKKRFLSALCALALGASLTAPAFAQTTYAVSLSAEEAGSDVPTLLTIPAQTPAAVGEEPARIVIAAPSAGAAVEIAVTGDAQKADVFLLESDGTYTTAEDTVMGGGSVCTMLPTASATVILLQKPPFTDVSRSAWYYSGVAYAYHNSLMSGTSAAKFAPNGKTDRAMLATILWRSAGQPTASGSFKDVSAGKYYAAAAAWMNSTGIMTGSGSGNFNPGGTLSREQLAVTLYRYARHCGKTVDRRADLSAYSDGAKVSSWAKDAMSWAVAEGLISGSSGNKLNAGGSASRAQLATILMRYFAQ